MVNVLVLLILSVITSDRFPTVLVKVPVPSERYEPGKRLVQSSTTLY